MQGARPLEHRLSCHNSRRLCRFCHPLLQPPPETAGGDNSVRYRLAVLWHKLYNAAHVLTSFLIGLSRILVPWFYHNLVTHMALFGSVDPTGTNFGLMQRGSAEALVSDIG